MARMGPMVIVPFKDWACYIGSKKIIKQWTLMLWEHINGDKILQHWKQKKQFGDRTAKQVDWDAI